jgi:small neutral amino acid transporter SnatA (MarC family)
MGFELSYGDIGILFFLTLGPLKAILPFARVTRGSEPAFRRAVAWRAVAIATAIILGVAFFGPFILPNWHVSSPAIAITCGIILFYQALRIIMQTPAVLGPADRENQPVAALSGYRRLSASHTSDCDGTGDRGDRGDHRNQQT